MADGTLRLTVDISPTDANDAFKLFGQPDQPMAITRLTVVASKSAAQAEMAKPKGGELSKLAAMWCSDPQFWKWLIISGLEIKIQNSNDARIAVLDICEINSRAELDNNDNAAKLFHEFIRIPFSEWLKCNA